MTDSAAESAETAAAAEPGSPPPTPPRVSDRAAVRLVGFAFGLVLALAAGFGVGRIAGPQASTVGPPAAPTATAGDAAHHDPPGAAPHVHGAAPAGGAPADGGLPGGLAISAAGYRLVPERTDFPAGRAQALRFQVRGPDGAPVTAFATVHERPLHLVVVRRDLTGYRHLHPTMAADGTWSVPLTLPAAGVWRAYADFTAESPAGRTAVTLGMDLTVTGAYRPRPLPGPATGAMVDGFLVARAGRAQPGVSQPVLFRVTRDGRPATLQPYLGAPGHLVVLREGDLGYVHVHPDAGSGGGGDGVVRFWLAVPSAGRYRAFFEFQVDGVVRTAEFTVEAR
ncbi:MAG TPA: hypothetical protein VNV66_13700 [Pilimelia sp.]|nr:hypothetical protein [Pilimelia sp.]